MLLIYLITGLLLLAGGFAGHQPLFHIEQLTRTRILNTLLIFTALFTLLMISHLTGLLPQKAGAALMMFLYSFVSGFFIGYGVRLIQLRSRSGQTLYVQRSFWTDHAPAFAALIIILYGLYRTSLLISDPVTGIRLTSGASLMAFGFFLWTLRAVPELRSKGILFLDKCIPWKQVIAWQWYTDDVIRIEYLHSPGTEAEEVRLIQTTIPADEKKEVEAVLSSRMVEWEEERKKLL